MNNKLYLGLASAFVGAAIIVGACAKSSPEEELKSTQRLNVSQNVSLSSVALQTLRAYIGHYNPSGSCNNPPIATYNGAVDYFSATNGSSETTVNSTLCYVTGMAVKSNGSCVAYIAKGTSATGSSEYGTLNSSTGAYTSLGSIEDGSGNPFYVEEMEFDGSGNLYIVKAGDYQKIYKVDVANIGNAVITPAALSSNTFANNNTRKLSLSYNGSSMVISWEEPQVPTTYTRVSTFGSTGALTGTTNAYATPNAGSYDISTYYNGGTLYLLRNSNSTASSTGTLYTLTGTSTVTNVGSVSSVYPRHDATYISCRF